MRRKIVIFSVACLFIVNFGFSATAQETTGTIGGFVRDATGAVIPGAEVVIRNSLTGVERRAVTSEGGEYVATRLPIGLYEVTVQKPGFTRVVMTGIQLNVDANVRVDVALQVGQVTESTTVTAQVSVLETETATLSGLVDSKKVVDLPLNGRNFAQLIELQSGVSNSARGLQGSGQFVNGARGSVNNFLLDGGDINDPVVPSGSAAASTGSFTGSAPGINAVSVDAVEEFRVITSGASAEFGRNSGAQINVITKSGTNDFHGSLFHFHRNRALDARSFFDLNPAFQEDGKFLAPPFVQNNFGGTVGGPIRRNRTFFFGSYEGFRQRQGVSVVNNIPSPNTIEAIRQQNQALGEIFAGVFAGSFAAPVANDLTPAQIIQRGTPTLTPRSLARSNSFDQESFMAKIDQTFAGSGRLSVRYAYFNNDGGPGTVSGSGLPATGVGFSNKAQNAVLNHTQPFGPAKLNEFRFTVQRNFVDNQFDPAPQALLDAGRLRTGAFAGQPYGDPFTPNGVPTINPGFGLPELGYTVTSPNTRASTTFQFNDSFTVTRGRMVIKFGGEVRRIHDNSAFGFLTRPNAQYASGGTTTVLAPGAPINFFTQNLYITPATSLRGFRTTELGPFIQTTTRLSPRLTLEAGLRWEYLGRISDVNGFLSNAFFAPNGQPIQEASVLASGPLGMNQVRLAPIGPGRELSMFAADMNNWAPRLGIAWSPDLLGRGKTTLRASYAVYYDRIFNNVIGNARNIPPFVVVLTDGGFPFGNSVAPPDPFTTNLPTGLTTVNPNLKFPRTQRWSFSIQRQIEKNTVLEAAYVGAKAQNLVRTLNPNYGGGFPAAFRPANVDVPAQPPVTAENFRPRVFATFSTRDSSAISDYHSLQVNLSRRFAQGLGFQLAYTWAHSIDDGSAEITGGRPANLTNRLPLRNANGTIPLPSLGNINTLRAQLSLPAFTNEADAARYFVQNFVEGPQFAAERGNSDFDLRHAVVVNFNYELPFGTGHALGGGTTGVVNGIISGWQANGILRFQTGAAFSLTAGVDVNGDGDASDRASLLRGSLDDLVNPDGGKNGNTQYLRPEGRSQLGVSPTPDVLASTLSRNNVFGPGLVTTDFSIFKSTPIAEALQLQFRVEAFNLLNQTNFGNPVANIASPVYGQIQSTRVPGRQIQLGLKLLF
jgi:hypothetical protein